ncbi:MAG: DUF6519 domain-containing protein [Pirellulales bacterium]
MKGDFSRLEENSPYSCVLMQQGRVQLDSDWNEQALIQRRLLRTLARDIIGPHGRPLHQPGFKLSPTAGKLRVTAGNYYVDGLLCVNDRLRTYAIDRGQLVEGVAGQGSERLSVDNNGGESGIAQGFYGVYLEVWERHLTAVEVPSILEPALQGTDTSTRLKVEKRILLHKLDANTPNDAKNELSAYLKTKSENSEPRGLNLNLRQVRVPEGQDACAADLVQRDGLRDNQLYRVEIHDSPDKATPRFKWSRDNASVAFSIVRPSKNGESQLPLSNGNQASQITATLSLRLPKEDTTFGLTAGDWVEIEHDGATQRPRALEPDVLSEIQSIDLALGTITLHKEVPIDYARNPRLRRWEDDVKVGKVEPEEEHGWLELRNSGIEIKFTNSEDLDFRGADYWLIPVRNGVPQAASIPMGRMPHYYAPVGFIQIRKEGPQLIIVEAYDIVDDQDHANGSATVGREVQPHSDDGDEAPDSVEEPEEGAPDVPPDEEAAPPADAPPPAPPGDLGALLKPHGIRALNRNLVTPRDVIRDIPAKDLNHDVHSEPLNEWLASALVSEVAGLTLERFLTRVERSVTVHDHERWLFVADAQAVLDRANRLDEFLVANVTRLPGRKHWV